MLSNRIRNLVQPPRSVPLGVVCSAMMGITGLFGAAFLILGLFFTLIFTRGIRPIDGLRLALSRSTASGMVTDVVETNSTENDVTVYQYEFAFTTDREREMTGTSFSTGRIWSVEDRVTVEYVPEDPSIARIRGARASVFSPWVLFVLVFPAIGAVMVGNAALAGLRQAVLLRYGLVADARVLSTQPTGVTVNDNPVLKYFYEIRTSMGELFQGSCKALGSERIGDETVESALYWPARPSVSTLVDAIPLQHPLDVDEASGEWVSRESAARTVLSMLMWIVVGVLFGWSLLAFLGIVR